MAEILGKYGVAVAVDLWKPGIEALEERAAAVGRKNILAKQADISKIAPLGNRSVDVCLMATVLHDLVEFGQADGTFK